MAICIYEHDAATIIPALVSELPYSTTLLRRIQHGIAYPYETAHILATFPPNLTPEAGQPWLAARVDLFAGRTTQVLIYSSLEAEHTSIAPILTPPEILNVDSAESNNNDVNTITKSIVSTFSANPPVLALARAQLLALLSYVKTNLLPSYLSYLAKSAQATSVEAENPPVSLSSVTPNNTNPTTNNSSVPLIPAPDPHAFLIGSLHTGLFSLLQRSGSYTQSDPIPNIRVHRFDDPPYYKYFFRRSEFSPEAESGRSADLPSADLSLPSGYRFHDREGREGVLSKHLDLVQNRTSIPRPRAQLSKMPGMAIYFDSGSSDADEMPIAWGFLGVDGALATLHVEPEHRGRGLAVPLSKAIMRRGMSVDGVFGAGSVNSEDSQTLERVGEWAHTEVAGYNKASRRVMEKIGGQILTTVTWTVIELLD
ncbi:Acyl-CoA N-acyltransferase [Penicillium expansum]|uniref:Acyl-CoA N-acyltransferase n=1 Tax=Penicillium expansum TaxID=27334 RepID=A0A0A2KAY1_PENEN|nr:Acyl-CoA N-acyltransferase [Penicillium expansum]KGO37207.1 Acyl-CoA N-acyltransferase [Penicillium expansum]KGO61515.1 Acyl-CoA N-acyltransferase [Penicillium expansum]KGO72414.1 Acyl-CoA N-acyltransferase [Penicillium expansum]